MADSEFMWYELATDDVDGCRSFYTDLLGWECRGMPMPGLPGDTYHIWAAGGKDIGGMYEKSPGQPTAWLAYVHVDDVDKAAARVPELGGTVTQPPMDVPGVGRMCFIQDPSGAPIALMTPSMPPAAEQV